MCGIFARINPIGFPADLKECRHATRLLVHRGPDAHGEWVSGAGDMYLGFRRLSILDLSEAANQPMAGADGNLLIFNGEIYNYRDLKPQLESRGCRFRTTGDTEVLLRALETWGEEALHRLEGMFAFLFWDARRREALIGRDFFGIKPLYLWRPPSGGVCVASEIKAFYALGDFQPEINAAVLPEYVRFRCVTSQATLLKGVSQVQPGETLRYAPASDRLTARRYWRPAPGEAAVPAGRDPVDHLQDLFRATVDRHLLADVPVGAQLSGGVDSSLSLAVAQKDLGRRMQGFHCSVEEQTCNETGYARAVAEHLDVRMESVSLNADRFFSSIMEKLTWHMDEPLGHPNAIGVHLVSALARPQVTVLISGEGADEVFAGYPRYSALLRHDRLRRIPGAPAVLKGLPPLDLKYYRALRKAGQWAALSTDGEIIAGMQFVPPAVVERLLGPGSVGFSEEARWNLLADFRACDVLTRCQLFDLATYLPALLVRQDKMSMAASIENRVPFVTPGMAALGLGLAQSWRATRGEQKVVLKKLLCRYVPREIVYRKKAGFGIPLAKWFRTPVGRERYQWLLDASCPLDACLDRGAVQELIRNYGGGDSETEAVWVLLTLGIWMRLFGSKAAVAEAGAAPSV
ncbi:MAG: asparagine synthase (glutamine-hydrolyzing) [Bryobacteraceae bacterium]|jgi:asparagine synthase (glutamine-hydrolysing)